MSISLYILLCTLNTTFSSSLQQELSWLNNLVGKIEIFRDNMLEHVYFSKDEDIYKYLTEEAKENLMWYFFIYYNKFITKNKNNNFKKKLNTKGKLIEVHQVRKLKIFL